MEIRRLTEADAEATRDLRLQSLKNNPEAFGMSYEEEVDWPLDVTLERIRGQGPDDVWLGAFDDNKLVGMLSFRRYKPRKTQHRADVNAMYVAPEGRSKGIGKALLQAAIEHARNRGGFEQIYLSVTASNTTARQLYLAMGFKPYGIERRGMKIGDQYYDLELMVLEL